MNSARDLAQRYTSTADISGADEAIDKWKTALSTTSPSEYDEETGKLWSTKKSLRG